MNIASKQDWLNLATAYELLAMALLVPDTRTAEALSSGEYCEAAIETMECLGIAREDALKAAQGLGVYAGLPCEDVLSRVRLEFTRLFVGEGKPMITPYAGVWADQAAGKPGLLFLGKESMDIERFMRKCGVVKDVKGGQSNDPYDAIGTMCEFMKYLCLVQAQAIVAPDGAIVDDGDYETFMAEHFLPYATWCCGKIAEYSVEELYMFAAVFLGSLVEPSPPFGE